MQRSSLGSPLTSAQPSSRPSPQSSINHDSSLSEPYRKDSDHLTPIYAYYKVGRLTLFIGMLVALLVGIIEQPLAHPHTLAIGASIAIYSLASMSIYFTKRDSSIGMLLIVLDGVISAIAIAEWGYTPWISLLLISLFYFNTLYHGGIKHCLLFNVGLACGIAAGYFLLGKTQLFMISDILGSLAVLVSAFIFLCLYAYYHRQQVKEQQENQAELHEEIKQQKLRLYEISQFLPKSAWDQIDGKKKASIERKPITIFFSDIVGFSSLSEELEAETLSDVLSSYLAEMSTIVAQYNGTIDKFIGDAIMVTFGDDESATKGVKKDAIACVSMALAMGKRMRELQTTWAEMGIKKPLQIRMGINSGYCTVGTFGTSKHLDHTALGVHVNLASRLESAGQPEEILISHETWSLVKDTILCKDKGHIKAKGFTHPVQVYQVINHRKELGSNQSYFSQSNDGFSMHLDLEKVKNYDREKVITALEFAAKKLKNSVPNK